MPAVSGSPTQNSTSVATTLELRGVPDDSFKAGDLAFIEGEQTYRLRREMPVPLGAIPAYSGNGYWEPLSATPSGPAGGDLDLFYPNPSVVGLEGVPIEAPPPTNGDVLMYNAAPAPPGSPPVWEHAQVIFGGGPPTGAAGGSLAGIYPNPTLSLVGAAGTYGDSTRIPVITTTIEGRVSNVTLVAVDQTPIYGSFSSTTLQAINTSPNAPNAATFNTVDDASGIQLLGALPSSQIQVTVDGIYEFSVSPELHVPTGNADITFFPTVNGTPVPNSSSTCQVGNNNRFSLPFVTYVLRLTAGQYVEFLFWGTAGTPQLYATATPGAPGSPAQPAIIVVAKRL